LPGEIELSVFLQQLTNGIMLGSVYSLVALGLTLIFGIMGVAHFAHGHFYMLGAYMMFFLMVTFGIPYWVAIAISVVAFAILGVGVEYIYRPVKKRPEITAFIVAIGMLLALEELVRAVWGTGNRRIPRPFTQVIKFAGVTLELQRLLVIVAAIVLILALHLFIKRTRLGGAIEAVAQDREGAALVGISASRVSIVTFAVATSLAAAAAALAAPLSFIAPDMANTLVLKAFVIIVIGGLGSMKGAIVGGYLLGILEAMAIAYVSATYKDVWAFGALILILAIRPTGLFGTKEEGVVG
jgi:branched-chain amino acid transport system permease protein